MSLYFRDRSVTVSFCPLLSSCFYLFISVFSISLSRLCFPVSAPPPPHPSLLLYACIWCLSFSNTSLCSFDLLCASLGLFESISHLICPTLTGFTCVFKISLLQLSVISYTLPLYHQCCSSRFWLSGLALWIKFDCLQLWTPFATLWFRIKYLLCCFWLLPSEYMWVCECMCFFSLLPSRCACVCWLRQVTAEWLIWTDSRAWIGWLDGQQPLNQQLTATSLLSWSNPTTSRHVAISSVCFCVRNLVSNSLVNSPS